ncbi:MAG: NUDIX hydrolase, partial [Elusimicrobia bacterium]|nr:NUDIX hydrolase [Elusimicrobiota bacterium]
IYFGYFLSALVVKTPEQKRILSAPEKTKKNRTIRLLPALPEEISPTHEDVMSVRILFKFVKDTLWGIRTKILFVKNVDGRWELPGGGKKGMESTFEMASREVEEELGKGPMEVPVWKNLGLPDTAQFYHEIVDNERTKKYRAVSVVQVEPKYPPEVRRNDESLSHRWMTLPQIKRMYMGFTLNTRMALLNSILESEYGVTGIANISPIEGVDSDVEGAPLRITTQDGGRTREFILRHRDQQVAPPSGKSMIPLARKKTLFDRSDYLILTRQHMVLEEIGEASKDEESELLNVRTDSDGALTDLSSDRRKILDALKENPLSMGVGELRELVYQMAEKNAASESGFGIDLGDPSTAGEGVTFFGVDPVTSEKIGNPGRLRNLLFINPDLIVILAQPMAGLPPDQVIVAGEHFVKNGIGYDVMVSGLRQSVLKMAGDRPFQIMTSPLLSLNTMGMAEDDPVRQASENALVYVLELLRGFSATAFKWPDVLKAFRALAEAA